jgi:hypothetical protein
LVSLGHKAKWLKDAEKNTKYFFNLEKRNYINKTIQQLINDKGDTITDFKEVLAEERSFYKSLYSKNHTVYDNINEINNFFFPSLIAETHSSFYIIPSQFNISSSLSFGISGSSGKKKLLTSLMLS